MAKTISRGRCAFCRNTFARNQMTRHLAACEKRLATQQQPAQGKTPARSIELIELLITGGSDYWLYVELPADGTLKHLDKFLRDIWVECCGHLSAFRIGGKQASWATNEYGELGKSRKIKPTFRHGTVIVYEYDFGSTTELELKYVAERTGEMTDKAVTVLARNLSPVITCQDCDQPAVELCQECLWDGPDRAGLCAIHSKTHAHDPSMRATVTNSPRMGVCGYEGSILYEDEL